VEGKILAASNTIPHSRMRAGGDRPPRYLNELRTTQQSNNAGIVNDAISYVLCHFRPPKAQLSRRVQFSMCIRLVVLHLVHDDDDFLLMNHCTSKYEEEHYRRGLHPIIWFLKKELDPVLRRVFDVLMDSTMRTMLKMTM
jgi:hypothetical protein